MIYIWCYFMANIVTTLCVLGLLHTYHASTGHWPRNGNGEELTPRVLDVPFMLCLGAPALLYALVWAVIDSFRKKPDS